MIPNATPNFFKVSIYLMIFINLNPILGGGGCKFFLEDIRCKLFKDISPSKQELNKKKSNI